MSEALSDGASHVSKSPHRNYQERRKTLNFLVHIRCFAAGAVIASLATAVFPKAYREDSYAAGIATALGLLLALALGELDDGSTGKEEQHSSHSASVN